ncbi:uncharacterized protein BT62DRAFT_505916 [Guyanagaster necrorhizus]|uniref:Defect at low temperature protein 1 n=1 Tax=Guyanagaster necrorhizus TaxID=856835 RepID=A0A9P7VZ83_9AGAR|nr:uncharacterized protein BT62DRAFT_505916 [Guyanagaster necrorhizus MCA 3950]KAG7450331.1 hypothetical protein BT62DRAFT_505916 [Guyanagaster necrorhizus MCA 3950]
MGSIRLLSSLTYLLLLLLTICAILLSCVALLSQAVRTSPSQSWSGNINALIIGASYVAVFFTSLFFCAKRRIAVRLRLQRISKNYKPIGKEDVPNTVHEYITREYLRACLVSYESEPKEAFHPGWGRPGTKYAGVRFRRALLDTVAEMDALAHVVIPAHPVLKPHARMIHHFRFIVPLLDDQVVLRVYDSAIQLARNSEREPTEEEFEVGWEAAEEIRQTLDECRMEMMEVSMT